MQQELGGDPFHPLPTISPLTPVGVFGKGYIDSVNNPDSPYAGWDFTIVDWPAQISVPLLGMHSYGGSQREGVAALTAALTTVVAGLAEDEAVTAFGYSSSANVMVRLMRSLQQRGTPAADPLSADQLSFILLGNPNRPNGGILQRFAGLHIPVLDVDFDGATPSDTDYRTLDISWEYDAVADFPTYPLNLLAVANSLIGGLILHGNYFRADIDGPRAFPDTTVGNVTYITLEPPHLPLLLPLYDLGVPAPLLDLVEPALTTMVDWGYDRTVGPGVAHTAALAPQVRPAAPTRPPRASRPATTRTERAATDGARATVPDRTRGAARSVDREADRHERNRRADRDRR